MANARGSGLARFRNSPNYNATVAKTLADQDVAAKEAAQRSDNVSTKKKKTCELKLVADPKKEGIPLFLQTQNRRPLTAAEEEKVEAFMAKKTPEAKAAINPKDAQAREEITKGLSKKEANETKRNNRFAKLDAKKKDAEALAAGALWDTRTAKWVLPAELAHKAKDLLKEYNSLVGQLRAKGINKWKYKAEPFLDVKEAAMKIGVLKAKLEGQDIAEEHDDNERKKANEPSRGKRRAVYTGPRKKDWALRPTESDEALLGRTLTVGKEVKRQEGAARTLRWNSAMAYLKKAPKATLGEVIKNSTYTVADYRLDIERGSLKS